MEVAEVRDATDLWRVLVSENAAAMPPQVALDAFARVHGTGQPGRFDSALLLCTDWRWRRTSGRVLAGLLDCEALGDADQDALAEVFLWQDKVKYSHPLRWIGEDFVEFDLDGTSRRPSSRPRRVHLDPSAPVTSQRGIQPPLRNWSATHILSHRHTDPAHVLERARTLPARDGAAVATGAVHAAQQLDEAAASSIVGAALRWGSKAPRLAALKHLSDHGEPDRARSLAADDPDASIRAWSTTLDAPEVDEPSLFD